MDTDLQRVREQEAPWWVHVGLFALIFGLIAALAYFGPRIIEAAGGSKP